MDKIHKLQIFADYFQLWLEDRQTSSTQREFLYTDQHISDRVWVDYGIVVMFTARNMTVPVELAILEAEPPIDLDKWDHVTETSLDIPSGQVEICGCGGFDSLMLPLQTGTYRVRMYHRGLASLSEDGLDGDDHYQIDLWFDSTIKTKVLKRWTETQ
ncbi:MAG: hypothetical protein ABI947_04650 [Chloroflexota bacterium]